MYYIQNILYLVYCPYSLRAWCHCWQGVIFLSKKFDRSVLKFSGTHFRCPKMHRGCLIRKPRGIFSSRICFSEDLNTLWSCAFTFFGQKYNPMPAVCCLAVGWNHRNANGNGVKPCHCLEITGMQTARV